MAKEKTGNWFARHKFITVILAVIVIAVIGSALSGSDSDTGNTGNTEDTQASQKEQETTAKIGQAARDGKFEFTVTGFKCGEKKVGTNEFLQDEATGQFCRLSLSIKNIGNESQSLFADNQKLVDAEDREYSYDSSATIYAAPEDSGSTWYDEINPGNSVTGDILFDVPTNVTPVKAMLHDSAFSGGVEVNLQ